MKVFDRAQTSITCAEGQRFNPTKSLSFTTTLQVVTTATSSLPAIRQRQLDGTELPCGLMLKVSPFLTVWM